MRSITLFSILLISLLCLQCQSTEDESPTAQTATMKGQIANASVKIFYLNSPYGSDEIKVEDGQFEYEILLDQPAFVEVFYNQDQWSAFLRPGDQIDISFDEEKFDSSFQMESPLPVENEFLSALKTQLDEATGYIWDFYKLDEAAMLERADSVSQLAKAAIANLKTEESQIDPQFLTSIEQFATYFTASNISNYPQYHLYAVPADTAYEASEALQNRLLELETEKPELLGLAKYQAVLKAKRAKKASEIREADSSFQKAGGYLAASFKAIEDHFTDPAIQEYLIFDGINDYLSFEGVSLIEEQYQDFMRISTNEVLRAKLAERYQAWAHLREGQPAPDFSYPDLDSVVHSLSDFKGKYVYIDVWATWCGPCIQEQPYLEKIEEEYAENDAIVFMGVSIDENKAAWEKYVVDKAMKGVQLLADGAWGAKINLDYNIKGIPRFILIDDQGNVINANAPRPSSEELKEKLKELLSVEPVSG